MFFSNIFFFYKSSCFFLGLFFVTSADLLSFVLRRCVLVAPLQRRIHLRDRCGYNYTVVLRLSACSGKGADHLGTAEAEGAEEQEGGGYGVERGGRGGQFDRRTL